MQIDARKFLTNFCESLPDEVADIYVFGLEEFCSIMNGSFYNSSNQFMLQYNDLFMAGLAQKYGHHDVRFQTIGVHHIGAIGIIAITPYPLKFSRLKIGGSGCGYGFSSMKGAVGLRMSYKVANKSVDLTFVNGHLAAHEGEVQYLQRNENLVTVMRSLDFGDGYGVLKPNSHTFLMGDLNYRTTKKYTVDSAATKELLTLQDQSLVHTIDIQNLVEKYDELYTGKLRGDIFTGFAEATIDFAPTYKFNVNTAIYNSKRSPSWCDRILFQSTYNSDQDESGAQLLTKKESSDHDHLPRVHQYNSIPSILQSDHLPVFLSITIPFEPPNPIVSTTGYLQVLPSNIPRRHSHDSLIFDDTVTGPTDIYMKPTKYDYIIQTYVRWFSDKFIGYGLFFSTTRNGRLYALLIVLAYWAFNHFT
jgi:hypothetical protein